MTNWMGGIAGCTERGGGCAYACEAEDPQQSLGNGTPPTVRQHDPKHAILNTKKIDTPHPASVQRTASLQ